jgi:Putative adhesin
VRPAPRRPPVRLPGPARRASPWWWLVLGSGLALAGVAVVLGIWWATSRETRITPYRIVGTLSAIELDLAEADVVVAGGAGGALVMTQTEEFAFGRRPRASVAVDDGVLRVQSSCADTVVGTCRVGYRIAVPDNVQLRVRSTSGRVRIDGLNGSARVETGSGPIAVDAFCGFQLVATSASGDVRGAAACSPDRLELRSGSGDVHAMVPAGRYRVDANSDRGQVTVRDLVVTDDASFTVQAISGNGDVLVEARG